MQQLLEKLNSNKRRKKISAIGYKMSRQLLCLGLLMMPSLILTDPLRFPDLSASTPIFFRIDVPEGNSAVFNNKDYVDVVSHPPRPHGRGYSSY